MSDSSRVGTGRKAEMPIASVVYWYAEDKMRMDGGGLRVHAWKRALGRLGFDVQVQAMWTIGGGVARGSRLSAIKRALVPMPFTRDLPDGCRDADLVVATVPAMFGDAIAKLPPERLVLDWMDLWSVASSNLGRSHWLSRPGGELQSRLWGRREVAWTECGQRNAYAGFDDFARMRGLSAGRAAWLPTPVEFKGRREERPPRRVGFIGNLDYPANRKSLRSFLDRHAFQIAAQGWETVVAGYGSDVVASWGYPVTVLGEVGDVEAFYRQVRAAVVPIELGGGIKVKAVEALANGIPVLTTEHVRSGFSSRFHPYLHDLAVIEQGLDGLDAAPIPQELFEDEFSTLAFDRGVRALLRPDDGRATP